MADQNNIPAPPPGFVPAHSQSSSTVPPPPSGFVPADSSQAQRPQEQSNPQSSAFSLKDLTGSSAEEWHQWNEQKKAEYLKHPIINSLKNLGGFVWGGVKALDEINPVGSIQTMIDEFHNQKEEFRAFHDARKQGKSFGEAMHAADLVAKERHQRSNPLNIFKAPDSQSDDTEHALYNSIRAVQGEPAARVAVAFKRAIRASAEDFKKDPDQAAGNMTVKLLPIIVSGGAAAPEEAAAETEAGVSSAARSAANEAEALSKLRKPGVISRIAKPEESARTVGAIKGETAIREATGITNTEVTARRVFGHLADDLRAQAKPTYQKMDQVLGGRWDANKNAIEDVTTALRRESDVDKLAKLKTKKADLLTEREQLTKEAASKGVSADDIKAANTNWRRGSALDKLESTFKRSVDAQERVNLTSAIKQLKNYDDLEIAMGSKENAAKLISRLEDELAHQEAMQTKYKLAQGTAKQIAKGVGVGAGMTIGFGVLRHIIGGLFGD